ncbi:MAG: AGE family epimerase/isomerase [Thermoanaerobaculaceae bacterium]|jgi:mannose/cellobiose epimerase-like protein (N-acyl-D-glucosamine 2-epimerase family)
MTDTGESLAGLAPAESVSRAAAILADDLRWRVLPYWSATRDRRFGGFRLADTETAWPSVAERVRWRFRRAVGRAWGATQPSPGEKHLVGQARVIIALAIGHRLGFDPSGEGLAAALAGAAFVRDRLWDGVHGGFAWCADRRGRVIRPEKLLYGQAFAVLALTELGRAAGRTDLLDAALGLFRLVHDRLHDRDHGGWYEHASADFRPLFSDEGGGPGTIDRPGCKSANTHLHFLEALGELLAATGDDGVRAALEEAIAACARFFPPDPAASRALAAADWTPIEQGGRHRLGHLLEHAWLLIRAHEALGRPAPGAALLAAVDNALLDFDRDRGGFVSGKTGGSGAGGGEKESWVQAEGLVALTAAVRLGAHPPHLEALAGLVAWILAHQRGSDGVWVAATDPAGRVTNPTRAGSWKAGYHEVRGAALFARAFGATPSNGEAGAVPPPR